MICRGISPWVGDSPPRHLGSPRLALYSEWNPRRPGLHPRATVGPGDAPRNGGKKRERREREREKRERERERERRKRRGEERRGRERERGEERRKEEKRRERKERR